MKHHFTLEKICVAIGVLAVGFFSYGKYWESKHPELEIENAYVLSIFPYECHSDLSSSRGYRVKILGQEREINFPENIWGNSIREGDCVNIVAKQKFPILNPFLDGKKVERVEREKELVEGE